MTSENTTFVEIADDDDFENEFFGKMANLYAPTIEQMRIENDMARAENYELKNEIKRLQEWVRYYEAERQLLVKPKDLCSHSEDTIKIVKGISTELKEILESYKTCDRYF